MILRLKKIRLIRKIRGVYLFVCKNSPKPMKSKRPF
jgi:hypothetical protein